MKKINYQRIFTQKIVIFILSIFVITFSYVSYNIDSELNIVKTIGTYIDDSLLYKRIYSDNNHQNEVILIKIDEKTLNNLQKSDIKVLSFSKELYAKVIEKLIEDYNVSTVWVDVIFANTSYYGTSDELILKNTLEKYQDQVVIATRWDNKETPLCIYKWVQHGAIEISAENRVRKTQIDHENYNAGKNCSAGEDSRSSHIQAFGIEVYKKYISSLRNQIQSQKKLLTLEENLAIQSIKNNWYLNFNYSTNLENNSWTFGFRSYSLIDILEWKQVDLSWKIILIWEVGTVLHDTHRTPINFAHKMPWVELHANIITSLLYDSYLINISTILIIIILFISSVLTIICITHTQTLTNVLFTLFFILIHLIVGLQFFVNGIIYPVFLMMYVIILSLIIGYIYKYWVTDNHRRFLKKAFSMYISPDMVDMIYKDPSKLNLKWEKWDITIFFSDIKNFTTISESMKTEELFDFLNTYFSAMTTILLKNQGTLDKYIGDAIMWFYNAPLNIKNHEFLACKTALEQMVELKRINEEHKKKWFPKIEIRIGINTGNVMHGNLGASGEKINYTVIWDGVNLASRLESIGKQYGSTIIIAESTYKKVSGKFVFRELDTIRVKWKSQVTKIYELLWNLDQASNHKTLSTNYHLWLTLYYSWSYQEAIKHFQKNKNDAPSENMSIRCKNIIDGKETVEDWVYTFSTK
jgi:class 3 adenylate cyclase/CHASE2 domain-containing sensor protein